MSKNKLEPQELVNSTRIKDIIQLNGMQSVLEEIIDYLNNVLGQDTSVYIETLRNDLENTLRKYKSRYH